MNEKCEKCMSATGVKERGWTDTLIRRFLDPPDKLAVNPHYRSGPKMRCYDIARVKATEKTPEWLDAQAKATKRSIAAEKASDKRRKDLFVKIESMWILVDYYEPTERLRLAIAHYNERLGESREPACKNSAPEFLERIQVNYLRHMATDYHEALDDVAGKIGCGEARARIKQRVLDAIAEKHPDLAAECGRQKEKMTRGFVYSVQHLAAMAAAASSP